MFTDLNEDQLKAVHSQARSLLIVAGPGTGKTHTLVRRILSRIHALPPATRISAITFTNKSTDEMRTRLASQISDMNKIFIGTFHQFCLMILKDYFNISFAVIDREACETLTGSIWPEFPMSRRKRNLEEISRWKNTSFDDQIPPLVHQYQQALRAGKQYDFDDLLLETLIRLREDHDVLERVRKDFYDVYIDEYQDINLLQHELLVLLIGDDQSITAIGDPDQAIYGFRGSDVKFFHSFTKDFPDAEVLYLRRNYRNASDLLSASRQIIKVSGYRDIPAQVASIYQKGSLVIHSALTDKAEAEFIVHSIEKMTGGISMFSRDSQRVGEDDEGKFSFGDIAVLFRLKSQARESIKALERSGIPFHFNGLIRENGMDIDDDLFDQHFEEGGYQPEKISLMTLHASKGLEFPCVFICGCEKGLMPLNLLKMKSDDEEERRLFYVGMTRAKERLIFTHAKKRMLYGKTLNPEPSPYLQDIEESLKNYTASQYLKKKQKADDGQMTLF
ncbi:MAG: UvrD-helicase domain-containing protein [Candidatus Omnitrophota bacterium]